MMKNRVVKVVSLLILALACMSVEARRGHGHRGHRHRGHHRGYRRGYRRGYWGRPYGYGYGPGIGFSVSSAPSYTPCPPRVKPGRPYKEYKHTLRLGDPLDNPYAYEQWLRRNYASQYNFFWDRFRQYQAYKNCRPRSRASVGFSIGTGYGYPYGGYGYRRGYYW